MPGVLLSLSERSGVPASRRVRSQGRSGVLLACLVIAAWPRPSTAEPAPEPESGSSPGNDQQAEDPAIKEAQTLFDEGIQLFNQGRFEEACPHFEKSLALFAGVGTRGKLAECWERMGRTASAHRLYLEVERLALKQDDRERARIARQRADDLVPRLAYLTITAGPSAALPGFAVTRNGLAVERRKLDTAVAVDPGEYVITATAQRHEGWKITLHIGAAEKKDVTIPALTASPTRQRSGGSAAGRVAAVVLVSVGAASLFGGTTFFALRASNERDKALELVESGECQNIDGKLRCFPGSMAGDHLDASRTNANLANLAAGLGLAAITTGVILWWRSGKSASATSDDIARALVVPAISPSSAGLVLIRSF